MQTRGNELDGEEFSKGGRYRYSLWKVWAPKDRQVAFIGLNPSIPDRVKAETTISHCDHFARQWGFGGFYLVNLFALCTKFPTELFAAADPVGKANNATIIEVCSTSELVVAAWGVHGDHRGRDRKVIELLRETGIPLKCFGMCKHGQPKHPSYVPRESELVEFV